MHSILEHILEIDSRKLYLKKAHSSLYEYLVKECGYSGSAAMRRISAARLMKEVPSLGGEIQSGNLNLSQISELSRAIKEKEKTGVVVSSAKKSDLVTSISRKTTQESQKEIALGLDLELKVPEKSFVQKDESVHLQITLTAKQYRQLQECRDQAAAILLSENQDTSLAAVIGLLAENFLMNRGNRSMNENFVGQKDSAQSSSVGSSNKTLTPKTRQYILHRDRCCQFKDPITGKTCGSTFNLEIDHKQSRWAGGGNKPENLQVLCKAHNNYKYQKEMNLRLC